MYTIRNETPEEIMKAICLPLGYILREAINIGEVRV